MLRICAILIGLIMSSLLLFRSFRYLGSFFGASVVCFFSSIDKSGTNDLDNFKTLQKKAFVY